MVHALRSRRTVLPEGECDAVVVIDDDLIAGVHAPGDVRAGIAIKDLGDVALLPGLVDTHVHINEPGRAEWEGFRTATRAAAAGGYTTLVDMPLNCLPETTDVGALEMKREAAAAAGCTVDYALWGGVVDGNQAEIEPLALAGVPGFKCFLIYPGCDGFTSIDRANLELALPHVARTGLPLLVHAELAGPIDRACNALNASAADWRKYATHLASRPDAAELEAIAMLLALCRTFRFHLHIVHLSTALALPMLAAAKAEGLHVTVETCPHYLHCAAEDIADGATLFKCSPPIRTRTNREALWAGLAAGTIDFIASDHSPCPPEMKRMHAPSPGQQAGRFDEAWGGIASLSVALPLLWTECFARGIGLAQLAAWTSAAPARLAGLSGHVGSIAPGKHANLVAFDSDATCIVAEERLYYRHRISPYMGEALRGVVRGTWFARGAGVRRVELRRDAAGARVCLVAAAADWYPLIVDNINPVLRTWNELAEEEAARTILPCNGSTAWALRMARARPLRSAEECICASDAIWAALPTAAWDEAFASHPRLGERHASAATAQSLHWSTGEQASANADATTQIALTNANRAYEAKFGRIFILCATGRSAPEMLALLQARLTSDAVTELKQAAEQQRQITQLRLQKWLRLS